MTDFNYNQDVTEQPFFPEVTALTRIGARFEDYKTMDVVGLEDKTRISLIGVALRNAVSSVASFFGSKSGKTAVVTPVGNHDINKTVAVLRKYGFDQFETLVISMPEGVVPTNMDRYGEVLVKTISTLLTIDKRCLTPMTQWAANVTNNPEKFGGQLLTGQTIKLAPEYATLKKQISDYKTNEVINERSSTELVNAYQSVEAIHSAGKNVIALQELVKQFESSKLLEKANRLSDSVSLMIGSHNTDNSMSDMPKNNIVKLSTLVTDIALELELLSVAVFLAKSTIAHFGDVLNAIETKSEVLKNAA